MKKILTLLSVSCAFVALACNDAGPPPSSPPTAVAPVTTVVVDGGAALSVASAVVVDAQASAPSAGDGGADFYACGADSDCVGVPQAGCCPTGRMEAVNKQSVDAYKASVVCDTRRRMCPQYRILDKRHPICGAETRKCEMVP